MRHVYNCYGVCIDDIKPALASEEYGHYDSEGALIIHYAEESEINDMRGFDKKNVEENGDYTIEVELPKGTKLCRYGPSGGKTTTLAGTRYELLALPYKKETVPYHEYVVVADGVSVKCLVTKGRVAKMFNSPGGAVQFVHYQPIASEIADGKIKEVFSWLKKKK